MPRLQSRIRKSVRRPAAEFYLLITLLSFAASVTLTRLFLNLTGYPQLGGKELHVAHLLWGGLLLFIASLLPLLFANRWVYLWTALLSGIGVGLFIDEVGKFITQNNNYFYPPAAPIIYAFFLLTVLLYVRIRRRPASNPRAQLYEVLEEFEEVLDHDLDESEKNELIKKLQVIIQDNADPDLADFAMSLLTYIESDKIHVVPENQTAFEKIAARLRHLESQYIHKPTLRAVISGGLFAMGIYSLMQLFPLLAIGITTQPLQRRMVALFQSGLLTKPSHLDWFSAWLALQGSIGILLIISAALLALKAERRGTNLAYLSLLLSLTVVDLLLFYFDQFSSILIALIQLLLLWGVLYYRRTFENKPIDPAA